MANPEVRTGELEPGIVVNGRGHIDYVIPQLSLAPGEYLVSLAIHDAHGLVRLDFADRLVTLRVQPGERPMNGKVDLLGEWEHPSVEPIASEAG